MDCKTWTGIEVVMFKFLRFLVAAKPTTLIETNSSFFLSFFLESSKKASKQLKPVMFIPWQSRHE